MCIPVISYLPGFISLFQLVMRIVLYNFGSFLYLVGHIFYHCGIHKSDKQDLYSVMPTLIKMPINTDQRQKLVALLYRLPSTLTIMSSFKLQLIPIDLPKL